MADYYQIALTDSGRLLSFNRALAELLAGQVKRQAIIVCIGSDRSTGDALGPLVGSKLTHLSRYGVWVWGTLEQPIHALNLPEMVERLAQIPNRLVIAIDASLGRREDVGSVVLRRGSLQPGRGVGKKLPAVGDIAISAVVNMGGFLEQQVLQCTSLSTVMQLAQLISQGLHYHFAIKQKG